MFRDMRSHGRKDEALAKKLEFSKVAKDSLAGYTIQYLIALQYLSEGLLSTVGDVSLADKVVSVVVEGKEDDVVVTYADEHKRFIQSKWNYQTNRTGVPDFPEFLRRAIVGLAKDNHNDWIFFSSAVPKTLTSWVGGTSVTSQENRQLNAATKTLKLELQKIYTPTDSEPFRDFSKKERESFLKGHRREFLWVKSDAYANLYVKFCQEKNVQDCVSKQKATIDLDSESFKTVIRSRVKQEKMPFWDTMVSECDKKLKTMLIAMRMGHDDFYVDLVHSHLWRVCSTMLVTSIIKELPDQSYERLSHDESIEERTVKVEKVAKSLRGFLETLRKLTPAQARETYKSDIERARLLKMDPYSRHLSRVRHGIDVIETIIECGGPLLKVCGSVNSILADLFNDIQNHPATSEENEEDRAKKRARH